MPSPENNGKTQHLLIGIIALLSMIVLGGTFFVGVSVGEYKSSTRAMHQFRKAGFPPDIMREFGRNDNLRGGMMGQYGFGGEVISIGDNSLTIIRRDGSENTISFEEDTPVQSRGEERSLDDIVIGKHVIAIGKPNGDGSIQATMLLLPGWNVIRE